MLANNINTENKYKASDSVDKKQMTKIDIHDLDTIPESSSDEKINTLLPKLFHQNLVNNQYGSSSSTSSTSVGSKEIVLKIENGIKDTEIKNNNNNNKDAINNKKYVQFRRSSSPAVLQKDLQTTKYFTFKDLVTDTSSKSTNKVASTPNFTNTSQPRVTVDFAASATQPNKNMKEKIKENMRSFFIDRCLCKLIVSVPLGVLATILIQGLPGDIVVFICYIIIFTILVFYPICCLLFSVYKLIVSHCQNCRFTRNTQSNGNLPKKKDFETEHPKLLTESSTTRRTFNAPANNDRRRRSVSARRASTLPAIVEDGIEEESDTIEEVNESTNKEETNL